MKSQYRIAIVLFNWRLLSLKDNREGDLISRDKIKKPSMPACLPRPAAFRPPLTRGFDLSGLINQQILRIGFSGIAIPLAVFSLFSWKRPVLIRTGLLLFFFSILPGRERHRYPSGQERRHLFLNPPRDNGKTYPLRAKSIPKVLPITVCLLPPYFFVIFPRYGLTSLMSAAPIIAVSTTASLEFQHRKTFGLKHRKVLPYRLPL